MAKVSNTMATEIKLDTVSAASSLKTLNNAIKGTTQAWKANEVSLKSAGDYLKAAEAKYKGIGETIGVVQDKISKLREKQASLDTSTKDGAEQYSKLSTQLAQTENKLASLTAQQSRAKSSMEYYKSGLGDLQKSFKSVNDVTNSYVERLQAEGKEAEAQKAKLGGLQDSVTNLGKQYKVQSDELERIKKESGEASDAYKQQEIRLNKTATTLAKTTKEQSELDKAFKAQNMGFFGRSLETIKGKLGGVKKESKETGESVKHIGMGFALGTAISNGASQAFGWLKGVTQQGYELAEAGGVIKKQWTNLGLSDGTATKMTAQIGEIRGKANMAGGAIDAMQKKFYATTNSATKARALTEVLASYGSAAGKSGDEIAQMSQGVAKLSGSAKVTSSLFQRTFGKVPELQKAIVKSSGMSTDAFNKALAAGKITGTQLQSYMVKASKTSGKAWDEFSETSKGKLASLQGTYTNLKVAFAKPLTAGVEEAIDSITKKKGKLDAVKTSLTALVTKAGAKTGQYIGKFIKFLVSNQKAISTFAGSLISIVSSLGKGVWDVVAGAIKAIGGHSKDASKGLSGVAKASQAIASHKKGIADVGKAIAIAFAVGKIVKFVKMIGEVIRITKLWTAAQWLFNVALDANPIGIAIVVIGALGAAFYEAYKHIKPFREWVNKTVKSVIHLGKSIGKWAGNIGKSVKNGINSIGRNWNKFKSSFKKSWDKHWSAVGSSLKHSWNTSVHNTQSFFGSMGDNFNNFKKSFSNSWTSHWDNMRSKLHSYWNKDLSHTKVFGHSMGDWLWAFKKSFTNGWTSLVSGVKNIFTGLWKDLKSLASNGMNDMIDIINSGINLVDGVIHTFGGKKQAIGPIGHVHFATGTGVFSGNRKAITKPTMAVLNDGNDSPETGNKEAVFLPNGQSGIVQGRNTQALLPAGTEVLNASETKLFMGMQGITHYAKGSSNWFGNLMSGIGSGIGDVSGWLVKKATGLKKFFTTAEKIIAHPIKSLDSMFNYTKAGAGVVADITKGMFNNVKKQAGNWWSSLWSMVDLDGDGGATGSGTRKKFIEEAMRLSKRANYKYSETKGRLGPNYYDCSGLVYEALKHIGVTLSGSTTVPEYNSTHSVSWGKAVPGDLAFWGAGGTDHVGIVTSTNGAGRMWNAENPTDGIKSAPIKGFMGGFAGLRRIAQLNGGKGDDSSSKKGTGNTKGIKSQVGSGFFKFMSKLADMFGDNSSTTGSSAKPSGDHMHWLKQAGIPTSDYGMYNYIITKESGWNPKATNPGTGAYGLPQSLPASKMARAGSDWKTNPITQLKWMKWYVNDGNYHSIRQAYNHEKSIGWYANGGISKVAKLAHISEGNKTESIVPWDITKRARAYQIMDMTMKEFAKTDKPQQSTTQATQSTDLSELIKQGKEIIGLMAELISGQQNPVPAVVSDNAIYNGYNRMSTKTKLSKNLGRGYTNGIQ
ncbi:peptidase M23 [Lactobacillus sp. SL9-6]|nr:peptidase M23 [Lactobacillus sp. SL9-6]